MLYKKLFKRVLYIIIPILVIFFICYMKYLSLLRCDGYHTGLNGVKIDDDPDKYSCFYDYPKKCYIDILSPFMDYSRFIGDCKTIRDPKQQKKYFTYYLLDEKFYENTTRFGFPITTTEYYNLRTQDDIKHFNRRVMGTVIDMDRYDRIPENYSKPLKPEVLLEFNKDNIGEITMEINKNEELAEERKNVGEMFKSKFDNVLFIFIDSLSREHFKRKLLIIKYYKERGFVTGQSINLCSRELFVTMNNCLNRVEFSDFDHENVAMFCDANYYNRDNPYPFLQGGFSIIRRCLYGRDSFEYVLEYGTKFWEAYEDNKKFLRLAFIDAHERSEEVVKYLDEPLTQFLENLYNKNLLKNTAIFFVSDHGNGMYGFYRDINADDFFFENTLAFWFMILSGYTDKDGIENLEENMQTLLTPYDIHDTLSDIVFDEVNMEVHTRNGLGESVFREINAKERSCMKYTEWPSDEMCHCRIPGQNYSTPIGLENMTKKKKKI